MTTFTVPAVAITANVELQSPSRTVPANAKQATVQLTGAAWPASVDNTRHVKCWGIQLDRGQGFRWWLFQGDPHDSAILVDGESTTRPADSNLWLPFGERDKGGGLPALSVNSSQVISITGQQVRLAILTDANITLGAVININ